MRYLTCPMPVKLFPACRWPCRTFGMPKGAARTVVLRRVPWPRPCVAMQTDESRVNHVHAKSWTWHPARFVSGDVQNKRELIWYTQIMSRVRRCLNWAVFLGFFTTVGVGVFHFVRYRPRCTIPELLFVEHLSADGSRLVTIKPPGANRVNTRGPVQVWDTHRGRVVNEFFGDAPGWFELAPDNKTITAGLDDGTLRLIDWRSGHDWQIEGVKLAQLPERPPWPRHRFSARGRWLYVDAAGEKPTCIINVATRKVVLRLNEKFLNFNTDDRLAFVRSGADIDVWDLEAVKKVASLAATSDWITESPDGSALLIRRVLTPPTPADTPPVHGVDVWDLVTFAPRFHRELSPAGYWNARFSPDGRHLALWCASDLALVDAVTGRRAGSHAVQHGHDGCFSADGSLWLLLHGSQMKERVTMIDVATGRVLWEKPDGARDVFLAPTGSCIKS
jgi:WD40 repeat protein